MRRVRASRWSEARKRTAAVSAPLSRAPRAVRAEGSEGCGAEGAFMAMAGGTRKGRHASLFYSKFYSKKSCKDPKYENRKVRDTKYALAGCERTPVSLVPVRRKHARCREARFVSAEFATTSQGGVQGCCAFREPTGWKSDRSGRERRTPLEAYCLALTGTSCQSTSKIWMGSDLPFTLTGSSLRVGSSFPNSAWVAAETRIWSGAAAAQSREATFTTSPMAV